MKIAGFWIRATADFLDALVLMAVGWALYLATPGGIAALGDHAVFVGLVISFGYSTTLTSHFGHGQTVGKRLLGLQVLSTTGAELTPARSAIRYAFVAFVAYAGAFQSVIERVTPVIVETAIARLSQGAWLVALLGLVVMTAAHPAKRGLHDWVAGSVVIYRKHGFDLPTFAALDRWPKALVDRVLLSVTAVLVAMPVVMMLLPKHLSPEFHAVDVAYTALRAEPELRVVGLQFNHQFRKTSRDPEPVSLDVLSVVAKPAIVDTVSIGLPIVDRLFIAARGQTSPSLNPDVIQVTIMSGFNLGIAKQVHTTTFQENITEPYDRRVVGTRSQI